MSTLIAVQGLGFSRVKPPIRPALAADAFEQRIGAVSIIEAKGLTMIPAEIKLVAVTLLALL